jgi:acyl carrier protein
MTETLANQLKNIIARELDVNLKVEDIGENDSLFEGGLALDSIAIVELISLVEEHFDFLFSDAELTPETFSNLNVLAEFISDKLSAQAKETESPST